MSALRLTHPCRAAGAQLAAEQCSSVTLQPGEEEEGVVPTGALPHAALPEGALCQANGEPAAVGCARLNALLGLR